MTYDKETRVELMEEERNEDIREKSNEIDDGSMDTWIDENKEEIVTEFIEEYNAEWRNFCKIKWNEENE